METRKLMTAFLLCLGIAGITFGSEPNDCNEVHLYGYGYDSDYNKDCRIDAADLNEITAHWLVDYTPQEPNITPPPPPTQYCIKTLYIDGVYVGEGTADYWLTWPIDRITIGSECSRWYMYNEYVGKLDDFAIYEGALSAAQVTAHWNAKGDYTAYQAAVQADNPLLWLMLDETDTNDGAIAYNSGSVDYRYGTYVARGPGVVIKPTAGFVAGSGAVELNVNGRVPELGEANGVCIDVWDGGEFSTETEGDVTIELWANYTDLNDYPRFFQHNGAWDELGSYGLSALLNDGNTLAVFGGGDVNFMDFENDINDGQWHHIVVTYDSTFQIPPYTPCYETEVITDYPVLWMRFDDEDPLDYSGNDHWVEYGSGTSIVEGVGGYGKSIYMDGSSSGYAACTNNSYPPSCNTCFGDQYAMVPDDITIELWYKTLPQGDPQPGDLGTFFQQIGSWLHEPNAPAVGNDQGQIRVFGGSGKWQTGWDPGFDGHWHQLVVTYDEQYQGDPCSMHAQLYVDGYLRAENTFTDPNGRAKLGPELSHFVVGGENDRGYVYNTIPGYFDEVAIYEGILAAERVLAHYEAWPWDCNELWYRQLMPPWAALIDRNQDCTIDFYDFAEFALEWALCNDPQGGPGCVPNWP
jgi:hypothetical protein